MNELEARRYRITAVLGKGGFGKVYRAKMEGAGGFTKDVAIKLMRDEEVPELILRRFRDEARILGLIRDRAIVNVDPPTRLAGRWAVVMEYVDGASIQRLMKLGNLPPSVVAELLQEVARALDKVYRMPGPDGEPLKLLHRDIKPANIQVTQDGEVKILDFGIAKANFEAREAHTQAYIGGTRGFIAPERLEGIEGPTGDIFSLGITAHYMLTGDRPSRRSMMGLEDPDTSGFGETGHDLLMLAARMRAIDRTDRPSAREVEDACRTIRRKSTGESLRRWAEISVPQAVRLGRNDEMVGHVLSETLALLNSEDRLDGLELMSSGMVRRRRPRSRIMFLMSTLVTVMVGALGLSLVVLLFGGALFVNGWRGSDYVPATAAPTPVAPAPATPRPTEQSEEVRPSPRVAPPVATEATAEPEPEVATAPQPAPTVATAPVPEPAAPEPTVTPQPAPAPVQDPPVEAIEAAPIEAPTGPTPDPTVQWPITISSVPLGAEVIIDGEVVGTTPVMNLQLNTGTHELRLVSGEETLEQTIEVGHRRPTRYVWKGESKLEFHY